MNPEVEGPGRSCYYAILGVRRNASASEIRSAYMKQARVRSESSLCSCLLRFGIGGSLFSEFWFPSAAEMASGQVGEGPVGGRRGQAAFPADTGGLFWYVCRSLPFLSPPGVLFGGVN